MDIFTPLIEGTYTKSLFIGLELILKAQQSLSLYGGFSLIIMFNKV